VTYLDLKNAMIAASVSDSDVVGDVRLSGNGPARISRYKSTDPACPGLVVLTIVND
jgi:hypothetical protein